MLHIKKMKKLKTNPLLTQAYCKRLNAIYLVPINIRYILHIIQQFYNETFFKLFQFVRIMHFQPKAKTTDKKISKVSDCIIMLLRHFYNVIEVVTLNKAITTEKKLINAVAKIRGLEKTAGLLNTWI